MLNFPTIGDSALVGASLAAQVALAAQPRTTLNVLPQLDVQARAARLRQAVSDCFGPACAAEIGRDVQVDYLILGRLTSAGRRGLNVQVLLVDVRNATAAGSAGTSVRSVRPRDLTAAANRIVEQLSRSAPQVFPPLPVPPRRPKREQPPTDPNKVTLGATYGPELTLRTEVFGTDLVEDIHTAGVTLSYQRRASPNLDLYVDGTYANVRTVTAPLIDGSGRRSKVGAEGRLWQLAMGVGWPYISNCCEWFVGGGMHYLDLNFSLTDPTFGRDPDTNWEVSAWGFHSRGSLDYRLGERCSTGAVLQIASNPFLMGNRVRAYRDYQNQYLNDSMSARPSLFSASFTLRGGCRF